jgi:hypothetical protein
MRAPGTRFSRSPEQAECAAPMPLNVLNDRSSKSASFIKQRSYRLYHRRTERPYLKTDEIVRVAQREQWDA